VRDQHEDACNESSSEENIELKKEAADKNLRATGERGPYRHRSNESHCFVQALDAKQLDRDLEWRKADSESECHVEQRRVFGLRVLIGHMKLYMVIVHGTLEPHSLPLVHRIPAHQNLLVRVSATTGIEAKGAGVCRFSRNTGLPFQHAFVRRDACQTQRR
jgi:hypothetical protein